MNKTIRVSLWGVFFLALILSTVWMSGSMANNVHAGTSGRYQLQIQQFKSMLNEQAVADERDISQRDRALVEQWLGEAEVLLANGNQRAVAQRLRRIEYALDMIRALVTASNIDVLAERQEELFYSSRKRIQEFHSEIEELQRRKQALVQEMERHQR